MLFVSLVTLVAPWGTHAQTLAPIAYTLRFPAPHTHYVEIDIRVATDGRAALELLMAVWTPGSYLVREFARHVEGVTARTPDGAAVTVEKSRKNRWRIETAGHDAVIVSYRVYGREMSVRTNWIDADVAILNGAPTFLTLADDPGPRPHDITLLLPPAWKDVRTGLSVHPTDTASTLRFRADDFDTLVDSPIVAGNPAVYEFTVDGVPYELVNVGESGVWHGPESVTDVEQITQATVRMWGFTPYDRYVFLNMLTEAGGGLEHRNSTLLMTSRWATSSRQRYLRWLSLVSHELFHAWNVKRLRPIELGPFDYENEVHTRSLWVVEGLTTYYADLGVHRAELSDLDEYLAALSRQIRSLQTVPGREVQPVALASYDAWIKYYRRDENSSNSSVSYYTKGAVIGFLLDIRIRAATNGARSLDDVLRTAYQEFSGDRGFTPTEFRATASRVTGVDLTTWFAHALDTTAELDYTEALDWLGFEFAKTLDEDEPGWIGLDTRVVRGRLTVSEVPRDTPGYDAGFNTDDELIAIGAHRVLPAEWPTRLGEIAPGTAISVLVSRRGELREIPVIVGAPPTNQWELQSVEEPTPAQLRQREAWLTGP